MFKNQIKKRRWAGIAICLVLTVVFTLTLFSLSVSASGVKRSFSGEEVILGGVPFGIKFSTEGVVVVGFSDIDGLSKNQNPAYLSGLRTKDIITKVDGVKISGADELNRCVEDSNGRAISLTFCRDGSERTVSLTPIYSQSEQRYKTGIWVKDSGAGIGTVTYIMPDTLEFGGLGHGICDSESGELIKMNRGDVMNVTVHAVKKGIAGTPGELKGRFDTAKIGRLYSNTECGVFGKLTTLPSGCGERIKVASKSEIRNGEAYVICTLADGVRRRYKAEVSAVNKNAEGSKCFMIRIVDEALIDATGGIVQGMSGSPVEQDGKLIGAVTHVMINDPTVGYAIFIENMLSTMTEYAQ